MITTAAALRCQGLIKRFAETTAVDRLDLTVPFYVLTNPSTVATRVLSLLPPFTPLVMLARVNVLPPPLWEVWLGIVLLVLGIVVAGWLAAKILRYALLMHGKRPTMPELLSVMRAT